MWWFLAGYFVGGFVNAGLVMFFATTASRRAARKRVQRMNELNAAKRLTGHVC